jgi:hypothetical protein
MGRRRRRDPEKERLWRRLVKKWQRSGLNVREFCDWQALSEPSFYAWRRELAIRARERAAAGTARVTERASDDPANNPQFLPVQVVADGSHERETGGCLEVRLPSGVQLRIPSGFDRQTLTDVLSALGNV